MLLFAATLVSVFLTYGYMWTDGDPLRDTATAWDSALFAVALMSILLAHELGHYVVARRHGFALSLPWFIPFPAAFGTFGAIIRLRSLPSQRTGLLEMGAAGPLAGLAVTVLVMALGLPGTGPPPELTLPPTPDPVELSGWMLAIERALEPVLSWEPIAGLLGTNVPEGHVPVLIFANPLLMDFMGWLILGAPPGRFDTLSPLALAGWVGCLLTAINLVPIGQLDGGHIMSALLPRHAPRISRVLAGVVLLGGLLWSGWLFWGLLLFFFGAWRNLSVPERPPLTPRARVVAALAGLAFVATFMPSPVMMDSLPATAAATPSTPGG